MIDLGRYFVAGEFDYQPLLEKWAWLLGDKAFLVHSVTAMGDIFLVDNESKVSFLDTIDGVVTPFADSVQEYEEKLQDRHVRKRHLATFVVRDLLDSGHSLRPGECFSPDLPPVLGGKMNRENFSPVDSLFHASVMGQIHRQVKDLPPGTPVTDIQFK